MEDKKSIALIRELMKVVGVYDYSGEASFQVILPTISGKYLRVGITDDDVGSGEMWFDYYEGLKIQGCPEGDLTRFAKINLLDNQVVSK